MRRSNLLTLRKFFNWNSSWFDNYNYSHLILKDLTINIYLTSIFKILKIPTSMFNIKYFNNTSILITFDLFIIWIYKLYKYSRKFITKSILLFKQFDSSTIINKKENNDLNKFESKNAYEIEENEMYNEEDKKKDKEKDEEIFEEYVDQVSNQHDDTEYDEDIIDYYYIFSTVYGTRKYINIHFEEDNDIDLISEIENYSSIDLNSKTIEYNIITNKSDQSYIRYEIKYEAKYTDNNFNYQEEQSKYYDEEDHYDINYEKEQCEYENYDEDDSNYEEEQYDNEDHYNTNYEKEQSKYEYDTVENIDINYKVKETNNLIKDINVSGIDYEYKTDIDIQYFGHNEYYSDINDFEIKESKWVDIINFNNILINKKLFFTKKYIYCLKQDYFFFKKNIYLFFKYIDFIIDESYFYKYSNLFFFKYNKLSNKLLFNINNYNTLNIDLEYYEIDDIYTPKPIYFKYDYDKFNLESLISLIFYIKNNNYFLYKIFKHKTKLSRTLKYLLFMHKMHHYKHNYSYSIQKEYLYWSLFFFLKYYKKIIFNKIIYFFLKKKLKCKYFFSFLKLLNMYKRINYTNYKLIITNVQWLKTEFFFFYKKNYIFKYYWGDDLINTYFFKKYFFSEFFNVLINSIQQTIYNYTNKQYFIYIVPNIFYQYTPYIKSAKLISDYIYIKAKRRFTLTKIFKTIKYWQMNEKIIARNVLEQVKFEDDDNNNNDNNDNYYYYNYNDNTEEDSIFLFSIYRTPLRGLRILISGPPYKARRKVRKFYHLWVADYQITGKMPLQYINLSIDYYQTHITLKRATLGLKTWILLESYEIFK